MKFRLGYIKSQQLQWSIFTVSRKAEGNNKSGTNGESTKCAECECWKVYLRTKKIKTTKKNPIKEKDIKNDNIMTVKMVSMYQYISWDTVSIYHTKGNTYPYDIFWGGCDFVDHARSFIRIKHKVEINDT